MAKIKFENGVVVNFNGNPTPQDIEEVAQKLGISKKKSSFGGDVKESFKSRTDTLAEGYLRQQQGKQSVGESILQTVGQGAGVIGDVAFSGASRLASAITPDFIEKPVVEAGKKLLTKAVSTPLVSGAISKYQQFEQEQPRAAANIGAVGNIASMLPVGKAGSIAGKTALKAGQQTGKVIGKTIGKTAELGAKTTKFGLSQGSGLGRETIEQVIKNPQMFTKEVVADMTRENIGKQIKSGINNRINQLQAVGKEYEPLRKLNKVIEVPAETYTNAIDKYGLKLSGGKLISTAESKPFLSGELKQIEDFISQYASTKHTPNSALNAREALSSLAKFDTGKSNNLTSLAKDLRVNLNKIIQDDKVGIPGIKSIDDYYSKEIKTLKELRKDYFVKGTTDFKDNALSKIANLTKEGRQSVLKRLQEIDPNIDFKVNILKAIEDIKASSGLKVGTYTRGGIAAGGLATGNIPLLLSAIAAQPEVLVPILRAFGRLRIAQKNIVSNIEKKLKSGADLLLNEKSVLNQAIDDYAKKIGEKVKNIKPGLTIEDVNKSPKNFKTAEDYVKAQGTPVYHGTNREFSSFDKANPIEGHGTNGAFGNGFYFTDKPDYAKKYADYAVKQSGGTGRIENVNVNLKNPFIINKNTSIDEIKRLVGTNADYSSLHNPKSPGDTALNYIIDNSQKFTDNLKKEGYDGVIATLNHGKGDFKEINVFSPSQIKTKSQLISEWNKANGKTKLKSSLVQEAKKYTRTINIQDKDDLEYLGRILSKEQIDDIKSGKMTNFRGTPYEDLARVNIISETPKTISQKLEGKIKNVKLKNNIIYHGTSPDVVDSIFEKGFKKGSQLPKDAFRSGGYDRIQNSISLTTNPKTAEIFSGSGREVSVIKTKLDDSAKIVKIEGIQDAIDLEDYISYLTKNKIDAVWIGGGEKELVVLNSKKLIPIDSITKSVYKGK